MLDKLLQYSERNPVFLHALTWTVYIFSTYAVNVAFDAHKKLFGSMMISLLLVLVFYFLVAVLKLFSVGKYGRGIGMLVLVFTISCAVAYAYLYYFLPAIGVTIPNEDVAFTIKEFLKNCTLAFYRILFYAILYVIFLRYRKIQEALLSALQQKLNTEKMNVELERKERLAQQERDAYHARFLTAQIYPHFLRNTLLGLKGQAILHKDEDMVQTIQYVSEILQYSLEYSRKGNGLVYIEKEIGFLKNMIGLIRTREESKDAVNYHEEGKAHGEQVPALILLTFIENVFRHGEATMQHPLDIHVEYGPDRFVFQCKNRKKENPPVEEGNGIGLENLRQRLFLFFGDQFELPIDETDEYYTIRLIIHYSA